MEMGLQAWATTVLCLMSAPTSCFYRTSCSQGQPWACYVAKAQIPTLPASNFPGAGITRICCSDCIKTLLLLCFLPYSSGHWLFLLPPHTATSVLGTNSTTVDERSQNVLDIQLFTCDTTCDQWLPVFYCKDPGAHWDCGEEPRTSGYRNIQIHMFACYLWEAIDIWNFVMCLQGHAIHCQESDLNVSPCPSNPEKHILGHRDRSYL